MLDPVVGSLVLPRLSVPGWNSLFLSSDAGAGKMRLFRIFGISHLGARISWQGGAVWLARSSRVRVEIVPSRRVSAMISNVTDCALYFATAGPGSSAGLQKRFREAYPIAFSRTSTSVDASCRINIGVASTTLAVVDLLDFSQCGLTPFDGTDRSATISSS